MVYYNPFERLEKPSATWIYRIKINKEGIKMAGKTEDMIKMMESRFNELTKQVEEKKADLAGLENELAGARAYLEAIGKLEKPQTAKRGRKPKNSEQEVQTA